MSARVLVVALDDEASDRISPVLCRRELTVDRVATGREACDRCRAAGYELVVCRYPLPDTMVRSLLTAVRAHGGPCRDTPILVLTIPEMRIEAKIQFERGPFRVASLQDRAEVLHEAVAQLLSLSPRRSARVEARLRVDLGAERTEVSGRVVNLSLSGMLVDGFESWEVGTRCRFEMDLGAEGVAVAGLAQVVRHTRHSVERVRGVALRFLDLEGEGRERLAGVLRGIDAGT